MDTARSLAVKSLLDMEQNGYSNLVVKRRLQQTALNAQDTQFYTRLFYGTLERMVTLDYILAQHSAKALDKLDAEVRAILRSGLYQCLFLDSVPVAAAVHESVQLCKRFRKASAAGFVNAVLRKASSFDVSQLAEIEEPVSRVSLQYAVCPALAAMLLEQYGLEETERMLAATLLQLPPAVRVNTLKTDSGALTEQLAQAGVVAKTTWLSDALVIEAGRYLDTAAIRDGWMRIQSLPAQYAALVVDAQPGQRILDLCAAPGGKTLTMAQQMQNNGEIVALDLYESRLALIDAQARLEGITIVRAAVADAAAYEDKGQFDAVLCDVPCSGYGELAHKPELRHKSPTAESIVPVQQAILQNAAGLVKTGGRIVYATCTLDKRENERVIGTFLREHENYQPVGPKQLPAVAQQIEKFVKFVPQTTGNTGFFIATLEKMW